MNLFYPSVKSFLKLFLFWIALFDIQRIIFSIYNIEKFRTISWVEFLGTFFFSLRLDLSMAAFLNLGLVFFLFVHFVIQKRWTNILVWTVIVLELVLVSVVHAGEVTAYPEWNHKLTSRVFTHLLHPDEVVRTANNAMTLWFCVILISEVVLGIYFLRLLGKVKEIKQIPLKKRILISPLPFVLCSGLCVLIARGGLQQIPINIDAAYFSKNYVANDLSVNSFYFFGKSALLYNRSGKGSSYPRIPEKEAKRNLADFFAKTNAGDSTYKVLENTKPNIVFILLESWSANAIFSLTQGDKTTPFFDYLSSKGLLFTEVYASAGTSEIGHASIFSGYPSLPEIAITMQPDRHRSLPSISQELKLKGYETGYVFSGDLTYGNIGGYLNEHGFDKLQDESDFPSGLNKGKLNFYDADLFSFFLKNIDGAKEPFLQCAFTGSTHSPYDHPKTNKQHVWPGAEADFMRSMEYADQCLKNFFLAARKKPWYKNTLFVLVADHGHATNAVQDPNSKEFFHIPLLFYGEPLKNEFRGKKINHLGSQADIAKTLLIQLGYTAASFKWSKDLLNTRSPEFALHSINRCYGWITPNGHYARSLDFKEDLTNTFEIKNKKREQLRCHSFMSLLLEEYEKDR